MHVPRLDNTQLETRESSRGLQVVSKRKGLVEQIRVLQLKSEDGRIACGRRPRDVHRRTALPS